MNIADYQGPFRCVECGSKGPGLRELQFRDPTGDPYDRYPLIICPGCAFTLQHVLKNEFGRPHMKEVRKQG